MLKMYKYAHKTDFFQKARIFYSLFFRQDSDGCIEI